MTRMHLLWQNLKANFQVFGSWAAKTASFGKLAIVTPLITGGWLIAQELRSDLVAIEPIGIPKTLSDNGYTPAVAGYRLRDALNAYAGASAPGDERRNLNSNLDSVAHDDDSLYSNLDLSISEGHELPDIVVPQIGLSLRAIASYIRSGLGMTGYAISGEITARDKKYALRLRIDGREVFSSELRDGKSRRSDEECRAGRHADHTTRRLRDGAISRRERRGAAQGESDHRPLRPV